MQVRSELRVLVTGASRGIGRAVARAFARRGCELGLVARSEEELRELAASLPGGGHSALPADVADSDQVIAAVERFGRCDVAVANAGVADYQPFSSMELPAVERMTRVNWLGTAYTVHAALPGMLEHGTGHIVIVSSAAGIRSFPHAAVYGATKAAQRGFGEALRHELDGTGVSVTTVYPGQLATGLHEHEKDTLPDWYHRAEGVPPEPIGDRIVEAVDRDAPAVFYPANVRALRAFHGLSPGLSDAILRALRGRSVAPRRH